MNMNELYERVFGVKGHFEKIFKNALSEGAFYVHKPSFASYFWLYEALEAVFCGFALYFMYYMKVYEEGLFKSFFGFGLLFLLSV